MSDISEKIEHVKKMINSILISSKDGLSVEELCLDYRALVGKTFPYAEFGYPNASSFLKQCSDIADSTFYNGKHWLKGVVAKDASHIKKLVSEQRKNPKPKSKKSSHCSGLFLSCNGESSNRPIRSDFSNVSRNYACNSFKLYKGPKTIPANIKRDVVELMTNFVNGIRLDNFSHVWFKKYGTIIPVFDNGFTSFEEFFQTIPDVVYVKQSINGLCLYPVGISNTKSSYATNYGHVTPSTSGRSNFTVNNNNSNYGSRNPSRLRNELKWLIAQNQNGILLSRFCIEYENLLKKSLNITTEGYFSIVDMLDAHSDILSVFRLADSSDFIIFSKRQPSEYGNDIAYSPQTNVKSDVKEKKVDPYNIQIRQTPADIVKIGSKYSDVLSLFTAADKDKIFIIVTHAASPSKFWVRLKETVNSYVEMLKELSRFYDSQHSAAYTVLESDIMIGLVCVAILPADSLWHRCIVTGIRDHEKVEVHDVDCGETVLVSYSSLRYLRVAYLEVPVQAVEAKFDLIKPISVDNKWSSHAKKYFIDRVLNKTYAAQITDIKDSVLSVILFDEIDDKCVHDELVNKLLAANKSECNQSTNKLLNGSSVTSRANASNCEVNSGDKLLEVAEANMQELTLLPGFYKTCSDSEACVGMQKPNLKLRDLENDSNFTIMRSKRYVKRISLANGKVFHIINHANAPFVIGSEILRLCCDKTDNLQSMLILVGLKVPSVVLNRQTYLLLFEMLKLYKVSGLINLATNSLKETIHVYLLESVSMILKKLAARPSPEILDRINKEIKEFDPNSEYWLGEASRNSLLDCKLSLNIKTLNKTFVSLKTERNKLICSTFYNENFLEKTKLQDVEDQLRFIEAEIQNH
ncbi:Uncharacterised protein g1179 [Pycnogonum litorale]